MAEDKKPKEPDLSSISDFFTRVQEANTDTKPRDTISKNEVSGAALPYTVGVGVGASFFGKQPDLTDFNLSRGALGRSNLALTEAELAHERARQLFDIQNREKAALYGPDFLNQVRGREAIRQYQTPTNQTAFQRQILGRPDETGANAQGRVQSFNQTGSDLAARTRQAQEQVDRLGRTMLVGNTRPLTGSFATIPGSLIQGPENVVNAAADANTAEQQRRAIAEAELMQRYRPYEQSANELMSAQDARRAALLEAQKATPGAVSSAAQVAGSGRYVPKLVGALSGMGAAMNAGEAAERYSKGDISGSALSAVGAGLDAASMLPLRPNPRMLAIKGIGTIGGLAHPFVMAGHDYFKPSVVKMLEKLGIRQPESVMNRR
jgi:hypothetical protein